MVLFFVFLRSAQKLASQYGKLHNRPISGIDWSLFDPRALACCSDDKYVKVIDTRTGKPTLVVSAGTGASVVRWSPHYATTMATTHGGRIKVWDTRMGTVTANIIGHASHIISLDWSNTDADEFVTASSSSVHEQIVRFWSVQFPSGPKADIRIADVGRVRYAPLGNALVTARRGDSAAGVRGISLWSVEDLQRDSADVEPLCRFDGEMLFDWWQSERVVSGGKFSMVSWNATAAQICISPVGSDICRRIGYTIDQWPAASTEDDNGAQSEDAALAKGEDQATAAETVTDPQGDLTSKENSEPGKTLSHEFYELRRLRMDGVTIVRLDEAERMCEIRVVAPQRPRKSSSQMQIAVRIAISYPQVYVFLLAT